MYTIFSKKLDTIIKRAYNKGIHSLSKKHQKLFLDHILEVEIIGVREVFIYRILWIVKTIPKVSCTISFDNNTKILMDIPQTEFNFYHLINYIKSNQ